MGHTKKKWLAERKEDVFVKQAKELGYKSRAVFKLKEIDSKFHILSEGFKVIELGCSPGGWSQYILEKIGDSGKLYAIDKNPLKLEHIYPQLCFIQTDVLSENFLNLLSKEIGESSVDVVLSDLSPNMSGNYDVDHYRQINLAKTSLKVAEAFLRSGGSLVVKVFDGPELVNFKNTLSSKFKYIHQLKPIASRKHSTEFYFVALKYRKLA